MAERQADTRDPRETDPGGIHPPVESSVVPVLGPYKRRAHNWIQTYLEYTSESESPTNYHIWNALSALSGAVKRNVWVDQGVYILYPNLYVSLVGPPGRTAKSTALYLAKQLVSEARVVKFGPNSCTREQLIKAMAEGKLNNQCAMSVWSTEFSSLIGPSGILMIQFLLDIYDCNYTDSEGWSYETKHQGKDKIVNPYLSGLFCTTPEYLVESMPDNIIGHGFTSRVVFVHEERERLVNPRPRKPPRELAQSLVEDLRHISRISGEFSWTDSGREAYDAYYHSLYQNIPDDHRIEGYHWRKKIHILKVAMLLALAERDDLILGKEEIDSAVQILHGIERNMVRVFKAVGKYEHATDLERVAAYIHGRGSVPLDEVYKKFYHVGGEQLSQIVNMLQQMTSIKVHVDPKTHKETISAIAGGLPWL